MTDLVTSHPRLDAGVLMRLGALTLGVLTELRWEGEQGTGGSCRASEGSLILTGVVDQAIAFEWLPVVGGRYVRPRFRCPRCQAGAYRLSLKGSAFLCWRCAGYSHQSRVEWRVAQRLLRVRRIRVELRADPRLGSPVERPRGMARDRYARLVEALNRAELAVYAGVGRELRSHDKGRDRGGDGRGTRSARL